MNILILGPAFPLRGGIAHFSALLDHHLSKRHHVETITFKRQYPSLLFPGKTQEERGESKDRVSAPQLMDSINPFNWIGVAREVRRRGPDLVIFNHSMPFFGPCFGTIARRAKKGTQTKVLYICHNIIPHERHPGDVMFTRYAFKHADWFIVQANAVEQELIKYFPGVKYRVVPHPVYESFGPSILKEEARRVLGLSAKKIMLFFGYVRTYKGLNVLLDAMQHLDDVLLLVVGEFYDDESSYRKRIHDLHVESRVQFVSQYVPSEKVGLYFSAADVVVLPYLSATQSGIVQIAYNFDKPVIATNVGGLSEVVLDGITGFIVPPHDARALADAVTRFYHGKREQEFSHNVEKEKQKYSWDRLIQAIEELTGNTLYTSQM